MSRALIKSNLGLSSSLSKLVKFRGFNTSSNVILANSSSSSKPTAAFKMKAKVYERKPAISKEFINPVSWELEKVNSVLLPELSSVNAEEDNLNKVFSLPSESKHKLEHNFPKRLADEFLATRETGLLFRQSTLDILNHVKASKGKSASPLIIDGVVGTGKSALLLQIVSQIMLEDWLVIYLPEVKSLVNGSRPYNYSASEGLYLQPTAAAHILALALKFNKETLSKISLGEVIKIGPHTYSEDSNLGQIVTLGSKDLNFSHQCLDKFLLVISQQTKVPVLIAIDEINTLYGTSEYYNTESRLLKCTELSVIKSLVKLVEEKQVLKNGIVLGATSWVDKGLVSDAFGPKDLAKPAARIHQASLPSGAKFDRYYTQLYSQAETQVLAKYYHEASIIYEELTPQEVTKKFLVSSGNPHKFYLSCARLL
ncbi:hypothetical protein DSO57_1015905 [Entomophthora muscae]|uniref:Uncharacterized protein n=1 Tax=Entomophthora muscae TaxID=34485 RepID=A0ACC2RWC5_9FUNG|nr:hypothetical protein DSO57_1015905 [Entomophthora muscae]